MLCEIAGAYVRHSPIEIGKWRVADFLRKRLSLKPVRDVISVTGGLVMNVDTADFLQRELFVHHDFEPNIRREILRILKPNDVYIDIGANIGFYALQASKTVGENGKVYAFEPSPPTRAALLRNIELNAAKNIAAIDFALSDSQGTAKFFLNKANNSGASSLNQSPDSGEVVEVSLTTYDQFADQEGLPTPSLIKIDVEGAEMKVLRGMKALLSRRAPPPIILEVSEWSLKQMGSSKDELFELMMGYNYVARLLSRPVVSIFSRGNIFFQYDVLFTQP